MIRKIQILEFHIGKGDNDKLELVMSVHINDAFMVGRPYTLRKIKEMIKLKFNIQESRNLAIFIGL